MSDTSSSDAVFGESVGWLASRDPSRPTLATVPTDTAQAVAARYDEYPVVVCAAAGGAGASVISALLAEYRAGSTLGAASWWVDAAPSDGDLPARLGVELFPDVPVSTGDSGVTLWHPVGRTGVREVVADTASQGAVPVIDAGARAMSVLEELSGWDSVVPVLVCEPRPDLLNRVRAVLTAWRDARVLQRAVLVIDCQIPTLNHSYLTELLTDAVAGQLAAVIGVDYDTTLGSGGALDRAAQSELGEHTWLSIGQLAAVTTGSGPLGQVVGR